jgi:hypothetical protein
MLFLVDGDNVADPSVNTVKKISYAATQVVKLPRQFMVRCLKNFYIFMSTSVHVYLFIYCIYVSNFDWRDQPYRCSVLAMALDGIRWY